MSYIIFRGIVVRAVGNFPCFPCMFSPPLNQWLIVGFVPSACGTTFRYLTTVSLKAAHLKSEFSLKPVSFLVDFYRFRESHKQNHRRTSNLKLPSLLNNYYFFVIIYFIYYHYHYYYYYVFKIVIIMILIVNYYYIGTKRIQNW